MNAKLKKVAGIAAMMVFFVALVINIKVTMDDPFAMVNEKALAEETTQAAKVCWDTVTTDPLQDTFYCGTCTKLTNSKPSVFAEKSTCTPSSPE